MVLIVEHNPYRQGGKSAEPRNSRFHLEIIGRIELLGEFLYIRTGTSTRRNLKNKKLIKELEANLVIRPRDEPDNIYEFDRSIKLYRCGDDYVLKLGNESTSYEKLIGGAHALVQLVARKRA